MHDADVSAQERLQLQSLRNVRALVEKLEAEERAKNYSVAIAAAWVVGAVVLVIGSFMAYKVMTRPARPAVAAYEAARPASRDPYIDRAIRLIATRANAPGEAAGRANREGRALLNVVLKDGGYGKVEVVKSSGDTEVDAALSALVKRSEPFGLLPQGLTELEMVLDVQLLRTNGAASQLRVARP